MIRGKNIILFVLSCAVIFLFSIIMLLEFSEPERVVLPFLLTTLISLGIFLLLNILNKDKFISKIFLIAILLHFIFILAWQLIKYYILGLPTPNENHFHGYIVDLDGGRYHLLGINLLPYLNTMFFQEKVNGGLFPKIIAYIYNLFPYNPFIVVCLGSIISSFTAIIFYLIGKLTFKDIGMAKIFALVSILNFAHIMNTSTLIRDAYIVFFMYLSLWLSYYFYKYRSILHLVLTIISLYMLFLFRPYASFVMLGAIIASFIFLNLKISYKNHHLQTNKTGVCLLIFSPLIVVGIVILFIKMTTFANILSVEDLITTREVAYSGSSSDYSWDFGKLYHIFPLLPFVIGYICMFFAPFPWEWVLIRRMIYVPDMLILYSFLPSFFKNLKNILKTKQYFVVLFFFAILFMFSIYCLTLGNSGSIHRNRGPYIAMIYLIAMSSPDKFLCRILNKIQKWRLV